MDLELGFGLCNASYSAVICNWFGCIFVRCSYPTNVKMFRIASLVLFSSVFLLV